MSHLRPLASCCRRPEWLLLCAAVPALCGWGCSPSARRPRELVAEGILRPGDVRPWNAPYTYEGALCTVRANAGPRVAPYLGALLDAELRLLGDMFGALPSERVLVTAYATLEGFRQHEADGAFTAGTRGTFDKAGNEIHVPLVSDGPYGPAAFLLHEGAHAYLHACFDFPVPPELVDALGSRRLPSVPPWLQEGLAVCLEAASMGEKGLRLSGCNPGRLRELRALIRAGRCPRLRHVLERAKPGWGSTADYAVAWGIVHVLLHPRDPGLQARRREGLRAYLEACCRGFFADPARDFAVRFAPSGELRPDFGARWAVWATHRSAEAFEQLFLAEGQPLEAWEARWRREVLAGPAQIQNSELPTLPVK